MALPPKTAATLDRALVAAAKFFAQPDEQKRREASYQLEKDGTPLDGKRQLLAFRPLPLPLPDALHKALAPAFNQLDLAARTLLRGVALGAGLGYGTALAPFVEDRPYQGTPASLMHVVR